MKSFSIFCGLALLIGLVWAALPYLNGRDKAYEERLVGALNHVEGALEASRDFRVDLYAPSIERRSKRGHWILSGIMLTRDSAGRTDREAFSADLESACAVFVDPTCWRIEKLVVGGRTVNISLQAIPDRESTPKSSASGTVAKESVRLPAKAGNTASGAASTPVQNATMLPATEMPATLSSEMPSGVDVEEGEIPAAGEGDATLKKGPTRFIQEALTKLGYNPGPVDGISGPKTTSAIKSYQRDHGLAADGLPSPKLLRQLHRKVRKSPVDNPDIGRLR
ncbi:MAG: peptidoglycan-binding domain-containing protein [Paracoccaceae bacterium]